MSISLGLGNRPPSRRVTTSITLLDSLPWSSSTSDPICPAHSALTAFHVAAGRGLILIVTRYSSDPHTRAVTLPGVIWRSQTDPFRTYVRPRGRRLLKSL